MGIDLVTSLFTNQWHLSTQTSLGCCSKQCITMALTSYSDPNLQTLSTFLRGLNTWKSHADRSQLYEDGPTSSSTWSMVYHRQYVPHGYRYYYAKWQHHFSACSSETHAFLYTACILPWFCLVDNPRHRWSKWQFISPVRMDSDLVTPVFKQVSIYSNMPIPLHNLWLTASGSCI